VPFSQRNPKGCLCKTPSRRNSYPSPSSEGEVPERSGGDGGVSGRRRSRLGATCVSRRATPTWPPPLQRGRNSGADVRGFSQRNPVENAVLRQGRRGPNCCKRTVSAESLQNGMAPSPGRAGSGKPAKPLFFRPILWKPTGNFQAMIQGLLSCLGSFCVIIGRARRVAAVSKSEAAQGFARSAAGRGRAVPAIFLNR